MWASKKMAGSEMESAEEAKKEMPRFGKKEGRNGKRHGKRKESKRR
jgi:hypothetical protein